MLTDRSTQAMGGLWSSNGKKQDNTAAYMYMLSMKLSDWVIGNYSAIEMESSSIFRIVNLQYGVLVPCVREFSYKIMSLLLYWERPAFFRIRVRL